MKVLDQPPPRLGNLRMLRAELNRIQVGVFQSEPQTNRLTAKVAHISSIFPLERVFCFVTIEFRRIGKCMSFVRFAMSILNLNLDATNSRG